MPLVFSKKTSIRQANRRSLGKTVLLNGRYRTRACDPLIKSQLTENHKTKENKDLQQVKTGAYKPAYKKYQETAANQPQDLPTELAEIVAVWPELPEHIKAAIKALVQTQLKVESE
jgi:hypothetical protein